MNKKQLVKSLKAGNYKIEMDKDCCCSISWYIEDGNLYNRIDEGGCYVRSLLSVTDENGEEKEIAEEVAHEPLNYLGFDMSTDEFIGLLEENDLKRILDEMRFSDDHEENDVHNKRVLESLIDFLKYDDYTCYIRYPHDFANEYDCILVNNDVDEDEIPEGAEKVDAERFADAYLESGDSATKYYIGFQVIEPKDEDEGNDEDEEWMQRAW